MEADHAQDRCVTRAWSYRYGFVFFWGGGRELISFVFIYSFILNVESDHAQADCVSVCRMCECAFPPWFVFLLGGVVVGG